MVGAEHHEKGTRSAGQVAAVSCAVAPEPSAGSVASNLGSCAAVRSCKPATAASASVSAAASSKASSACPRMSQRPSTITESTDSGPPCCTRASSPGASARVPAERHRTSTRSASCAAAIRPARFFGARQPTSRARVLEVRIQSPPAVSQANFRIAPPPFCFPASTLLGGPNRPELQRIESQHS